MWPNANSIYANGSGIEVCNLESTSRFKFEYISNILNLILKLKYLISKITYTTFYGFKHYCNFSNIAMNEYYDSNFNDPSSFLKNTTCIDCYIKLPIRFLDFVITRFDFYRSDITTMTSKKELADFFKMDRFIFDDTIIHNCEIFYDEYIRFYNLKFDMYEKLKIDQTETLQVDSHIQHGIYQDMVYVKNNKNLSIILFLDSKYKTTDVRWLNCTHCIIVGKDVKFNYNTEELGYSALRFLKNNNPFLPISENKLEELNKTNKIHLFESNENLKQNLLLFMQNSGTLIYY